jgi:PAS domain S-box-containing protein
MLGYNRQSFKVLKFYKLHPTKEKARAKNAMKDMIKNGKVRIESKFKRADGTIIDVDISARVLKNEENDDDIIQEIVRDITEQKKAEEVINKYVYELKGRVKELNALYTMSKLVVEPDITINKVLRGICKIILQSCQYPDITCTRLTFEGKEFKTKNFSQSRWGQFADIKVAGEKKGSVEVYYKEKKPANDKGLFYKEERDLINTIALEIGIFIEQRQAEKALLENERKLSEQNVMLQEKNIALREVMVQLETEKDRIGQQVNSNVDRLLLPLVTKLRSKGSSLDKIYIDLLEENIKDLTCQFGEKVSDKMLKLTQKEVDICNLIKYGLSSKEIANMLNISHRTVETHRNNIRKKLGIGKQEVNLVTYLKYM